MSATLARAKKVPFAAVLEALSDGKPYVFYTSGMRGYFFKAPYPDQESHTKRDGALSAITYWEYGKRASPTLMLYDFEDDWTIREWHNPEAPNVRNPRA